MKSIRRDTKRQLIALKTLRRLKTLTKDQIVEVEDRVKNIEEQLINIKAQKTDYETIKKRREILVANSGLRDVFTAFWLTLSGTCDENGCLSKQGYIRFHEAVQQALLGEVDTDENRKASAEIEWLQEIEVHGDINQTAFCDVLFETIDTWSEILDPSYYAAFAWSLLDSIADVSKQPPRLRSRREIKCFTKLQNEAARIPINGCVISFK